MMMMMIIMITNDYHHLGEKKKMLSQIIWPWIYLFIHFFSFIPSYYVYDNHDHRRWLIFCNVFFFLMKDERRECLCCRTCSFLLYFHKSNHILKKERERERENKNFENGTFNFIWNFLFLFCRTKKLQLVISSYSRLLF